MNGTDTPQKIDSAGLTNDIKALQASPLCRKLPHAVSDRVPCRIRGRGRRYG